MTTTEKHEQELRDLQHKQARELEKLQQEQRINERLPDVGHKWSIHIYDLYGSVGGAQMSQPYGYHQNGPTLETLLTIAEALPGAPMVRVKGTFTSYLAKAQLPTYENKNTVNEEEQIAPWIINAHGGPGARNHSQCDLEWITELSGIGLIRVKFELPYMMALRFSARRKNYMGGHSYEGETCEVDRSKLFTIYGPDGATPVAELGPRTTWAAGSPEYPRKITQAWTPLDDPATATVADFARALITAK